MDGRAEDTHGRRRCLRTTHPTHLSSHPTRGRIARTNERDGCDGSRGDGHAYMRYAWARENKHARLGSLSLLRRRRANIEEEDEGLDFTRNTFFFLSRGWGSGRRPFSLLYPHPRIHGAGWVGGAVQCSSFFSFCGVLITVFELFFFLLLLLFFWHFTGRIVHTARDVKGKREERVDRTGRTDGLQVCCSSHARCLGGKGKGKKHRCFWYHHLLHLLKQERKRKQKNDSFSQPLSLIHFFTNASALFVFLKLSYRGIYIHDDTRFVRGENKAELTLFINPHPTHLD